MQPRLFPDCLRHSHRMAPRDDAALSVFINAKRCADHAPGAMFEMSWRLFVRARYAALWIILVLVPSWIRNNGVESVGTRDPDLG